MIICAESLLPPRAGVRTARASAILGEYLRSYCSVQLRQCTRQRELFDLIGLAGRGSGHSGSDREADVKESNRICDDLRSILRDPRPHAERELRRLIELSPTLGVHHLDLTARRVLVSIRPPERRADGTEWGPNGFDICLPEADAEHSPVYVELRQGTRREAVFTQPARHGACRGNSGPLLQAAAERADLGDLVLIAFAWARRNLC